jgi:cholestenol delta-isomerase
MAIVDKLEVIHPYYPIGISLSGGTFTPNDWDVLALILAFAGGWVLIFGVTLVVVKRVNPNLKSWDQALVLWFVLSKFCQDT